MAELEGELAALRAEVARLRGVIARRAGSLDEMLARRGFRVFKKERDGDVLKPAKGGARLREQFYRMLHKYSFRLFLRDVIKRQDGFTAEGLVRYSTLDVVDGYIGFLAKAGLVEGIPDGRLALAVRPVKSFGPTLEWYVAELLRREYGAEAAWGAVFKGKKSGGDYDLLASVEGRLLYAEVKSSPPKQIYAGEVRAYIDRVLELSPDLSIFIMDTELRMKDKIVVLFEEALPKTPLVGLPVERVKAELFRVGGRIFIINSKDGLAANIGEIISLYLKKEAGCPAA